MCSDDVKYESVRRLCWDTIIREMPCQLLMAKATECPEFGETQIILHNTNLYRESIELLGLVSILEETAEKKIMNRFNVSPESCKKRVTELVKWFKFLVLSDDAHAESIPDESKNAILKLDLGTLLLASVMTGRERAPQLSGKPCNLSPEKIGLLMFI